MKKSDAAVSIEELSYECSAMTFDEVCSVLRMNRRVVLGGLLEGLTIPHAEPCGTRGLGEKLLPPPKLR